MKVLAIYIYLFIILFSALYISYASATCPSVVWQETATLKKINDQVWQFLEHLLQERFLAKGGKMKREYEKVYTILDTGSASENTSRLITEYLGT